MDFKRSFYLTYWPRYYSKYAIIFSISILLLMNLLFINMAMPLFFFISGLIIIILFFQGLSYYTSVWYNIPLKYLFRKLFWYSFIFRLIFLCYVYLITYLYEPLNISIDWAAMDAWIYHNSAIDIKSYLLNPEYFTVLKSYWKSPGDWGFPIYLSIVHSLAGDHVIVPKILNCFWNSLTVVFLAKIALYQFGEKHARLTGIIAMLIPTLLWYSSRYLKEPLMIFIIVFAFYQAVLLVRKKKFSIISAAYIFSFTFVLFYFRTVIAVLTIFSLSSYFVLNSFKWGLRNIIILIITPLFLFSIYRLSIQTQQSEEVVQQYERLGTFGLEHIDDRITNLQNLSIRTTTIYPFIILTSFFAPFPSFLMVDDRQIRVIAHYPNELIRNIIFYFAILGIIILFKRKFVSNSLFLIFSLGYTIILGLTGNSQIDRFQSPGLPFILLFISVGIIESKPIWLKRYNYYLVIMFIMVIVWNIFKVNIRGLI